ncbi:efflux RND transporter periplasmic adaptor subunit [Candidatus Uabimicrobium amorphum]|uniref:Cation transporter n=1 Tax=Uabimicrobium amorphum TaxID=2596890 RepID=A0A5S9ITC0_UABAM|nr:efflux RND transporter periplasmic adaptor subunit [Candidatus Uabimicrobium amorphum]BBM87052.1 cation transporter [Candidatus Uabimicrobium amorphum]
MSNLFNDIKKELASMVSSAVGLSPLSPDASEEEKKIYQQKLMERVARRGMWSTILLMPVFLTLLWLGTFLAPEKKHDHSKHKQKNTKSNERKIKFWTCSMHPQIKLPNNDAKCPVCFMDLVPVYSGGNEVGPNELSLTKNALKLAKVKAEPVLYRRLTHTLRIVGKVDYDETKVTNINLWTPGKSKLDRMFIDFTGANVKKGAPLVEVYSPDLIAAQGEYLSAYDSYKKLVEDSHVGGLADNLQASKRKLIDLGMTEEQIHTLENKKQPQQTTIIYSPVSGTVVGKLVNEGEWHGRGMSLYRIADLSKVWVKLDAYETDIGRVRNGQQVEFETEAYPGKVFTGKIAFIDPFLNTTTRTVRLRVNVNNPDGELKPGMFVRASIKVRVAEEGQVITHKYTKKPIKIRSRVLTIPHTAPLFTGKRAVVYLQKEKKKYDSSLGKMKVVQRLYYAVEVELGPRVGDYYVVLSGLEEGQMVVSQGVYKIDSALQIMAKPSMMNPPKKQLASEKTKTSQENVPPYAIASSNYHKKMKDIVDSYLKLTQSLAKDNVQDAHHSLLALEKHSKKVLADGFSLPQISNARITEHVTALSNFLAKIDKKEDVKLLRKELKGLTRIVTTYLEDFGHEYSKSLHRMYCPMTKGYWWQFSEELQNPYFGKKMLRCGNKKTTLDPLQEKQMGKIAAMSGKYWDSNAAYHQPINELITAYLNIGNIMAQDQVQEIHKHKKTMVRALAKINTKTMVRGSQTRKKIRSQLSALRQVLMEMHGHDIKQLRRDYFDISNALIAYIKDFGHLYSRDLYIVHCPMYRYDLGGSWIQDNKRVNNPYFGSEMLRCGDIEGIIPTIAKSNKEGE